MSLQPFLPGTIPNRTRQLALGAVILLVSGCAVSPQPVHGVSVIALAQQPAEHALLDGIRSYETGEFDLAGTQLRNALLRGLSNPGDQAAAHKYLAFIDCAFSRVSDCETQFRAALAADPQFRLTPTEVGHPVWGPVYRRIMQPEDDN